MPAAQRQCPDPHEDTDLRMEESAHALRAVGELLSAGRWGGSLEAAPVPAIYLGALLLLIARSLDGRSN